MKKLIKVSALILICIIIAIQFLYTEYGFFQYKHVIVSVDPQEIFSELPELQITEEEKNLYSTIFTLPVIKEHLYDQAYTSISYDDIRADIEHIIPPYAEVTSVSAGFYTVYIHYTVRDAEVSLNFTAPMSNPLITKTAKNSDVDYRAIYSFEKDREIYEKWEVKFIWPFTDKIDSGAADFFIKHK